MDNTLLHQFGAKVVPNRAPLTAEQYNVLKERLAKMHRDRFLAKIPGQGDASEAR